MFYNYTEQPMNKKDRKIGRNGLECRGKAH